MAKLPYPATFPAELRLTVEVALARAELRLADVDLHSPEYDDLVTNLLIGPVVVAFAEAVCRGIRRGLISPGHSGWDVESFLDAVIEQQRRIYWATAWGIEASMDADGLDMSFSDARRAVVASPEWKQLLQERLSAIERAAAAGALAAVSDGAPNAADAPGASNRRRARTLCCSEKGKARLEQIMRDSGWHTANALAVQAGVSNHTIKKVLSLQPVAPESLKRISEGLKKQGVEVSVEDMLDVIDHS